MNHVLSTAAAVYLALAFGTMVGFMAHGMLKRNELEEMRVEYARRMAATSARHVRVMQEQRVAYVLDVVDNGPQHGWKWLVWDWDPEGVLLDAGAVEGCVVPYALQGGYPSRDEALLAGLAWIRLSWAGDVVIREAVRTDG